MKKSWSLLCCLLLCLPFFGCGSPGTDPTAETAPPTLPAAVTETAQPTLPAAVTTDALQAWLPDVTLRRAEDVTPPQMAERTGLRLVRCTANAQPAPVGIVSGWEAEREFDLLLGPKGCVEAQGFYGACVETPVWADLDRDGTAELLYQTVGPTSGLYTLALWAYGLEDGFPVLKASVILNLNDYYADGHLAQQDAAAAFVCDGTAYPLTMEGSLLTFAGGKLPPDVSLWGGLDFRCVGMSMAALREEVAALMVYDSSCCLIWRQPGFGADGSPEVFAAISGNWHNVSRLVSFRRGEDGTPDGWRMGVPLIETPTDLDALLGLSPDALTERLGPWHFDSGSGLYLLGWFTEDGLLLQVTAGSEAFSVSLYDPFADAVVQQAETVQLPTDSLP